LHSNLNFIKIEFYLFEEKGNGSDIEQKETDKRASKKLFSRQKIFSN
jgi:hypothetical protein